jgi:O-antigen/teichoic acid export membrane protein
MKKDIIYNYLSQIINIGLSFFSSVLITRMLGPEGRGDFSIFLNSSNIFLILLGFSLSSNIIYFLNKEKLDKSKLINSAILLNLITFVFIIIVLYFATVFEFKWVFVSNNQEYIVIVLFALNYIINQLNATFNGFNSSQKKFINLSLLNIVINSIALVLYVILFNLKLNVELNFKLVILINLTAVFIGLIYNIFLSIKLGFQIFKCFLSFLDIKRIFKYAFLMYSCNLIQVLNYKLDFWIVDYYHGSSEIGIYSIAVSLSQMLWILPNAISMILFSYISGMNQAEAISLTIKYSKIVIVSSILVLIFFIPITYYFIPLIYGIEFNESKYLIPFLMIGIVPFCLTSILATFFVSQGKIIINFYASFLGLIFAIIFYFLLIPSFKSYGAAFASSLSYTATFSVLFITFVRYKGINLKSLYIKKSDLKDVLKLIKKSNE